MKNNSLYNNPKRILFIFNKMDKGGAETFTMNVYNNINREQFQFDFICLSKEKGYYDNQIKKMGGNIFLINYPNRGNILEHIKQLFRIMKREKYAAVHCPTQFHSGLVLCVAYFAGIKIRICHSHSASDDKKNSIIRHVYIFISRLLINIFATKKLSCGQEAGELLYGKNARFIIINNGINVIDYKFSLTNIQKNRMKFLKRLNISENTIIVGHVGRFEDVKNHKYVIKLAEYAQTHNFNIAFILLGVGSLKDEIENTIYQKQLNNVKIMGLQSNIAEWMNFFDVLILPSKYEGFPMVILEALAAGTPCIVSNNVSKEVEIIPNMITFLDIDDINIEKWISNINSTYKDGKNIKANQELINLGYDIDTSVNKLVKIYNGKE